MGFRTMSIKITMYRRTIGCFEVCSSVQEYRIEI